MITLTGKLRCATAADAAIVTAHLADQIMRSRGRTGLPVVSGDSDG